MQALSFLFIVLVTLSVTYAPIPDRCQQDVEAGACVGNVHRWFFNSERNRCEPFKYSGCLGNENNFKTYSDCLNECVYAVVDVVLEEEVVTETE